MDQTKCNTCALKYHWNSVCNFPKLRLYFFRAAEITQVAQPMLFNGLSNLDYLDSSKEVQSNCDKGAA